MNKLLLRGSSTHLVSLSQLLGLLARLLGLLGKSLLLSLLGVADLLGFVVEDGLDDEGDEAEEGEADEPDAVLRDDHTAAQTQDTVLGRLLVEVILLAL